LLALVALPLAAWGPKGHRLIADASLQTLPPPLRDWYTGNEARYRDTCLEPDKQKDHDPEEDSRHHLHTEAYGGAAGVPFDQGAARSRLGPIIFLRRGQLPWAVGERYGRLVEAFRAKDRDRIIVDSAWLCHYVADAQVPLHSTRNSNGKETGQKGIHKRWETALVDWKVNALAVSRPAQAPADPRRAPWVWITESHAALPGLLAADDDAFRTSGDDDYGEPGKDRYWDRFWALQGERLLQRLQTAAERTGDLLLAAWVEAGNSVPPGPSHR
jgi:hypothetical protein